jgi:hypothetical protein
MATFGLTHLSFLAKASDETVRRERESLLPLSELPIAVAESHPTRADEQPIHPTPWIASVPEAKDDTISVEARILLIIGLLLHRAPQTVRSHSFSRSFQGWHKIASRKASLAGQPSVAASREMSSSLGQSSRPSPPSAHTTAEPRLMHARPSRFTSEQTPTVGQCAPIAETEKPSARADALPSPTIDKTRAVDKRLEGLADESRLVIESAWGGLLYLMNVVLHLELYADFSHPLRPGLDLPIWRFLALIGEEFASEGLSQDLLWSCLKDLCGSVNQPADEWIPPEEWVMPAGWLSMFPSAEPWRWSFHSGRLRLVHPAGFVVYERIMNESGLGEELHRFRVEYTGMAQLERHEADVESIEDVGLRRWVNWLVPYVRARVSLALAVDENDVMSLLLRRHCRIELTDGRLDAFFSLQDHPIEIRLAGLDRNPGWVPAAGRYVEFHYA